MQLRLEYTIIPENVLGIQTSRFRVPIKLSKKDNYLALGGEYNSYDSDFYQQLPFPLPLINYCKRLHPNWPCTMGVPPSKIQDQNPNKKHIAETLLFLDVYFVNIQNDIELPNYFLVPPISLSVLLSTRGYQYKFTKKISLYPLRVFTGTRSSCQTQ